MSHLLVNCPSCKLSSMVKPSMVGKPTERVSQIVYMVSEADKRYYHILKVNLGDP